MWLEPRQPGMWLEQLAGWGCHSQGGWDRAGPRERFELCLGLVHGEVLGKKSRVCSPGEKPGLEVVFLFTSMDETEGREWRQGRNKWSKV